MRKSKPKKRYVLPDPKFQDTLVTKFVNYLMEQGKKSTAYTYFLRCNCSRLKRKLVASQVLKYGSAL
jgi:ribosomal protein S7